MGLFGKPKTAKIKGEYFGSHPDLTGHHKVELIASDSGIEVREKKTVLLNIKWDDVNFFDYGIEDNTRSDSRTSATRVAAFGALGAVAKKSQTVVNVKLTSVLALKSGEFVIETEVRDNGMSSTASSMAQSYAAMKQKNSKAFRIFVANHINSARS